jgi:hypothetical protein
MLNVSTHKNLRELLIGTMHHVLASTCDFSVQVTHFVGETLVERVVVECHFFTKCFGIM